MNCGITVLVKSVPTGWYHGPVTMDEQRGEEDPDGRYRNT